MLHGKLLSLLLSGHYGTREMINVFKQDIPPLGVKIEWIKEQTREFERVLNPREKLSLTTTHRLIRWTPPETGWVKLNTNATVIQQAAGGGLLRDP